MSAPPPRPHQPPMSGYAVPPVSSPPMLPQSQATYLKPQVAQNGPGSIPPNLSRPSSRPSSRASNCATLPSNGLSGNGVPLSGNGAPLPAINRSQSPYGTIQGGRSSPYATTGAILNNRGHSPSPHHHPSPQHAPNRPPPPPPPINSDGAPFADPDASLGSIPENAFYPGEDRIPHIDSSMSDAAMTPVTSGAYPPPFGLNPSSEPNRPPVAPKPKPPPRPPGSGGDGAAPPDRIRVLTHNGSISSDDSD